MERRARQNLRSSTYGWHPNLNKARHSVEQTGRRLRAGMEHGITIRCNAIPHPGSFSTNDGGSKLTPYQSGELRWGRFRISPPDPDYDGEAEEEGQDGEGDMEEEDSEIASLEYRTVNGRVGGRLGAKYWTQQIGDAEPANAAIRDGGPNAGQWRVTAMNSRRTTLVAGTGDRVRYRDWGSNTGERRRHVNPPGWVNEFHNHLIRSRLGQFQIP